MRDSLDSRNDPKCNEAVVATRAESGVQGEFAFYRQELEAEKVKIASDRSKHCAITTATEDAGSSAPVTYSRDV